MKSRQVALIAALSFGLGLLCGAAWAQTVEDDVRDAVRFLEGQPELSWPDWRFVSLRAVEPGRRSDARAAVELVLNCLGAANTALVERAIPLADGRLLAYRVSSYTDAERVETVTAWLREWESLAAADPYSRIVTEVLDDGRIVRGVSVSGGWIEAAVGERLRAMTGSAAAVLDAAWFVRHAAVAPGYYRFATLPASEDEFLERLGVSLAAANRAHGVLAATVRNSRVTGKPRRVQVAFGFYGSCWITADVAVHRPERDAARNPLSKVRTDQGQSVTVVERDAREFVAVGANGLPLFYVSNADGARQDTVDANIATDYSESADRFNRLITPMLSCARCHEESGLRSFDDYVAEQRRRGSLVLLDPLQARKVAELYREPVAQRRLRGDREGIDAAAIAATGVDWSTGTAALAWLFREMVYGDVSPRQAARELGVAEEVLAATLFGVHDPYVDDLRHGVSVSREAWYASFHLAALAEHVVRGRQSE